jgi:hypothetical protein
MSKKNDALEPESISTARRSGVRRKDPNERIRMVGEREVTIDIMLTPMQLEDEHHNVMAFLDQKEEIEEKKKENMKNFAAQLAAVELQIDASRRLIKSKRRRETVIIEEWLTGANEIVQIRQDTRDQVGDVRKARSEELQEKLFGDKPTDPVQENAAPPQTGTKIEQDTDFPTAETAFGADLA